VPSELSTGIVPRRINQNFLQCSQLSVSQARQRHGSEGDGCWDKSICHRRRSHYRKRRDNNAFRRSLYRQVVQQKQAETAPEELSVQIDLKPVADLYLYRQKRQDALLHEIAISIWQDNQRLLGVTPIHCAGMQNQQIQRYLMDVLATLRDRYGITKFEPEIRLELTECPIEACPLKPKAMSEVME